jgi:hypothetical protein
MDSDECSPTQELAVLYAPGRLTAQEDQNALRELSERDGGYEFEIIRNLEGDYPMEGKSHYFRFLKRHWSKRGLSSKNSDFGSVSSDGSTRAASAISLCTHDPKSYSLFKGDENPPTRKRRWIHLIRNRCLY